VAFIRRIWTVLSEILMHSDFKFLSIPWNIVDLSFTIWPSCDCRIPISKRTSGGTAC